MNSYPSLSCFKNTFVFMLCVAFLFPLHAQNTWVGGKPGQESAWNQARNWSLGHVPNWSDEVIIIPNVSSASGYYPVIDRAVEEIPFLLIEGGAELNILPNGFLCINGETTYNHGILNLGMVKNDGILSIINTSLTALEGKGLYDLTGVYTVDLVPCEGNQFRLCVE